MEIYKEFLPGREPSLVRVDWAAKMLMCTDRTVRRKIRAGRLRAERVGLRVWGIYRTDVETICSRRGLSC